MDQSFIDFHILFPLLISHFLAAVLLRNLAPQSTEESVLHTLQGVSELPIRSVRIGRDPQTGASRGVCYIELNSVVDAMHLNNYLTHKTPLIDGRIGKQSIK